VSGRAGTARFAASLTLWRPDSVIVVEGPNDGRRGRQRRGAAHSPGPVTITARSELRAGAVEITVTPIPVATVSISPDTATLEVGATRQLTATLPDAAGSVLTGRPVEWSSSDEAVVSVAQDGTVSAVAEGPATNTAASEG
jgi:uncharacterized protein YjdB